MIIAHDKRLFMSGNRLSIRSRTILRASADSTLLPIVPGNLVGQTSS